MADLEDQKYISAQITKAERRGWFDKINYPNAERCRDLLKEIRTYCDKRIADRKESEEIDRKYPWPEPL